MASSGPGDQPRSGSVVHHASHACQHLHRRCVLRSPRGAQRKAGPHRDRRPGYIERKVMNATTHYKVLDEYTDGYLLAKIAEHPQGSPWRRRAEALLTAPPDWRQSIWVAAHARAFTYRSYPSHHDPMLLEPCYESTGIDMNDAIVEMVDKFHNGFRPVRYESVEAEADADTPPAATES